MENLVQAVTDRIKNIPNSNVSKIEEFKLSKEESEALEEAERLADLYEDIKPSQYRISSGHLFIYSHKK